MKVQSIDGEYYQEVLWRIGLPHDVMDPFSQSIIISQDPNIQVPCAPCLTLWPWDMDVNMDLERLINVFGNWCLRSIMGYRWNDYVKLAIIAWNTYYLQNLSTVIPVLWARGILPRWPFSPDCFCKRQPWMEKAEVQKARALSKSINLVEKFSGRERSLDGVARGGLASWSVCDDALPEV